MSYIIAGCSIIDHIVSADGSRSAAQLGGSLYALTGIKPYCDDVLLVTTAGPDFADSYGAYYRTNDLSFAGVHHVLPYTQRNILTYQPDGRWHETSAHGADFVSRYSQLTPIRAAQIVPHCSPATRGIYLEASVTESVWPDLHLLRSAAPHAVIMWEVPCADAEDSDRYHLVRDMVKNVDIFSINLPEAQAVYGTQSEAETVACLQTLRTPCFFRVGTRGAYMIHSGRAWYAPAVDLDTSVDPTGCGNCSTGAALYGYAEGLHPLRTVITANLAAGLNAQQHGPYPHYTPELRACLLAQIDATYAQLREE
jgi:sugar/nucleoside kinase (ribokinase family)